MTTPNERTRSLKLAQNFLLKILDPKKSPKVPKAIREEAASILKHYPTDFHIDEAGRMCPEFFYGE
jgi:hypothetical protein